MSYKNVNFNKRVIRKRMLAVIIYGIIFLISTIAYYFVNTSNAQKVLKVGVSVIDKDMNLEITNFELKAPEKDNKFSIELAPIQQGLWVNNYKIITKEEFQELKKNYEEKLENKEKNDKNETKQKEQIEKQTEEEKKKEEKEKEKEEKVKKENEKKNQKTKKIQLTEEQLEEEKVYIIAEYDYKEYENELIYNKNISNSQTTDKINISVSGYMPEQAELDVKKIDIEETEKKIENSLKDKDVELIAAYDIKIVDDENQYEPEDFDENATVSIKGFKGEKYNIWHIKNDDTVELIKPEDQEDITFKTDSFSEYGIEEVISDDKNEETVNNSTNTENTVDNTETTLENDNQENPQTENNELKAVSKGPLRAAARNLPDSTLEIDDYNSDYYYYLGQNYTESTTGNVINKYSESNLVKVTLNYYGFAQGETDNEKKGRISLQSGEEQDIVKNIRCVPVQNGNISIELMENPFMDKPTGYGFGGWTPSSGTVIKDAQNLTYSLTAPASGDITVNLYANWVQATVVYLNPDLGNDNLYDGLSEQHPFGSWGKALQYINSNSVSRTDRERNIIVLTGNIDTSINYSRGVTGTRTIEYDVSYNVNNTITSGTQYIISTGTGNGSNAISTYTRIITSGITNETISTSALPENNNKWTITRTSNGYSIRNVDTNTYLAYNPGVFGIGAGLELQSGSYDWQYSNHRLYFTRNGNTYYLYYNNSWGVTTSSNSASNINLLTYPSMLTLKFSSMVCSSSSTPPREKAVLMRLHILE